MQSGRPRAVIIGAGIGGLTAAQYKRIAGFDPVALNRTTGLAPPGSGP